MRYKTTKCSVRLSELVMVCVAMAIMLTYPLQLTSCMEVVWGCVSKHIPEKNHDAGYYLVRALLILVTSTYGCRADGCKRRLTLANI